LTPAVRPGRVLVVGAINVDLVVRAPHLPAPGETVVGPAVVRHGGGKGANAAVAAARAGAAVAFVGALGTDAAAADAERDLLAAGVDCDGVQRLDDQPTGMALIVVDPDGENQIAVGAGANHALDAGHVGDRVARAAGAIDCVLVSTEVPDAAVAAAVRAAATAGVRCVLNPAPPVPTVLDILDQGPLLTPNRGELDALARTLARRRGAERHGAERHGGRDDVTATPEDQARALGAITGAPVCVTLGADGVLVCDDGQVTSISAPAVNARDATGAGDTFNGVLAAWLAGGAALSDAVRAATTAASLSVAEAGARAGMPTREAIVEATASPQWPWRR
jgi:ribokinase